MCQGKKNFELINKTKKHIQLEVEGHVAQNTTTAYGQLCSLTTTTELSTDSNLENVHQVVRCCINLMLTGEVILKTR
jgi:CTP-dependent riboflavin kinase